MEKPQELHKIKEAYETMKELAQSPIPIIRDNAMAVLAILKNLLAVVDPEGFWENPLE